MPVSGVSKPIDQLIHLKPAKTLGWFKLVLSSESKHTELFSLTVKVPNKNIYPSILYLYHFSWLELWGELELIPALSGWGRDNPGHVPVYGKIEYILYHSNFLQLQHLQKYPFCFTGLVKNCNIFLLKDAICTKRYVVYDLKIVILTLF